MALNIDKKVYRNLQEQVSWLTTTVATIIDVTNAAKLEELVTELEGYADAMSGYADTMQGYANTMGDYADTMQGYANTMGGYATTMEGYALQVDTWTNNISVAALTVINSSAITPLTVEQQNANWGTNIGAPTYIASSLDYEAIYTRIEVINNILYLVLNFKLTNNTGAAVSFNAHTRIMDFNRFFVTAYASKIIDLQGNNLAVSGNGCIITCGCMYTAGTLTGNYINPKAEALLVPVNDITQNAMSVRIFTSDNTLTINDGSTKYFTGRVALTLI